MHATLSIAIAFIIGGSFGVILGRVMRAGKLADLDAENERLADRLLNQRATIKRLQAENAARAALKAA